MYTCHNHCVSTNEKQLSMKTRRLRLIGRMFFLPIKYNWTVKIFRKRHCAI